MEFKKNNLDLIRLLAASQVAIWHFIQYSPFNIGGEYFLTILGCFPGVPIFFFISGLLISRSFERSPDITTYVKNRFLRIYPALVVCVVINTFLIGMTGYFNIAGASTLEVVSLVAAKITFLQFYNPEFMRGFGDGVMNGSLWTICVELQFYFLVPFIYRLVIERQKNQFYSIVGLLLLFFIVNRIFSFAATENSEQLWWKLLRISFGPWFYMFLLGVAVQKYFEFIMKWVVKLPLFIYLIIYLSGCFAYLKVTNIPIGNNIPPLLYMPLAAIILRLAYHSVIPLNCLRGNDCSYGIYIWHMPILNQFIYMHAYEDYADFVLVLVLTILLSILSWWFVEKPSLSLKRFSLKIQ